MDDQDYTQWHSKNVDCQNWLKGFVPTTEQLEQWQKEYYRKNFGKHGAGVEIYYDMQYHRIYLDENLLKYKNPLCETPPEAVLYDAAHKDGLNLQAQYVYFGRKYDFFYRTVQDRPPLMVVDVITKMFHDDEDTRDLEKKDTAEKAGMLYLAIYGWEIMQDPHRCVNKIRETLMKLH
ncbi:hypothetical protein FHS15_005722 [Paenibacillus castaneae]|uniref:hypothetical protein n=1 Tax=Paenibacillus castaneae TaxID=474957 RepID=UPI00141AFC4B|nr:hypothetical protein [Paenibacillus castaneae]NIK80532.1 hypothetical protein [Paenibacillus castaneae]